MKRKRMFMIKLRHKMINIHTYIVSSVTIIHLFSAFMSLEMHTNIYNFNIIYFMTTKIKIPSC